MNVEPSFLFQTRSDSARASVQTWFAKWRWLLLFVVVPTALAAIYYGVIAADVYTSEARFVIKSPDQKRAQVSTLANLIQTTGLSAGQEQTNEVLAFVKSRDALRTLERDPGVKARYSVPAVDFLARYPQPFQQDSFESLYRYYGKMVDARLDSETGLAVITVRAFTPRDAFVLNTRLLELSEGLVNQLNARAERNGIAEAQKQVDLAAERAKEARLALSRYRNGQALIDPAKQAQGVLEISAGLVAQRAALQAQLDQMRKVAPSNPSIPALANRIAAISGQIASQDSRVVGTDNAIASKLGGYEDLLVEQEFATQRLNVANASLVQARAEAVRQQFYLERVVDPNLPDMALLPRRLLNVIIVAAASLCLYFIGWMFFVGILEHASDD